MSYKLAGPGEYDLEVRTLMETHVHPVIQGKVQEIAYNDAVCNHCGEGSRFFGCVVMTTGEFCNFEATTACLSDGENDFNIAYNLTYESGSRF